MLSLGAGGKKEVILLVFYTVFGCGYKKEGERKDGRGRGGKNHLRSDERPTMDSSTSLSILVWLPATGMLRRRGAYAVNMLQCQNWRGFQATRDIADLAQEVLVQSLGVWLKLLFDNFTLRCCHG
jgi:hypothetical protein